MRSRLIALLSALHDPFASQRLSLDAPSNAHWCAPGAHSVSHSACAPAGTQRPNRHARSTVHAPPSPQLSTAPRSALQRLVPRSQTPPQRVPGTAPVATGLHAPAAQASGAPQRPFAQVR